MSTGVLIQETCCTHSEPTYLSRRKKFLKVWWHAATLFIYFYINRADIQYFIYTTRRAPLLLSSLLFRSVEGLLWGAEPRFELGPAVQQAGALLSEPHRTLEEKIRPNVWRQFYRKFVRSEFCIIYVENTHLILLFYSKLSGGKNAYLCKV